MSYPRMTQRFAVFASLLAFGSSLFMPLAPVQAATETWQALPVYEVSERFDADVMRTALPQRLAHFQRVGDHLLVVMYPEGCRSVDCGTRDVGVIRGTQMKMVRDVPTSALDATQILQNGNRVIWAVENGVDTRWNVYELDMERVDRTLLKQDLALGRARRVRVFAGSDRLFYEVQQTVKMANGRYATAIYEGESVTSSAFLDGNHIYLMNGGIRGASEEVQSVGPDASVVSTLTFDDGAQEIWIHQAQKSWQIPGSYTKDGYLLGAQFVDTDHVAFFSYQKLKRVNVHTGAVEDLGTYLKWDAQASVQQGYLVAAHGIFAFLSEDSDRHTHFRIYRADSENPLIATFPADAAARVALKGDKAQVVYNQGTRSVNTDQVAWQTSIRTVSMQTMRWGRVSSGRAADYWNEDHAVGVETDAAGLVQWGSLRKVGVQSDAVRADLGYATDVWMISPTQAIWQGLDGNIHLGTVRVRAWMTSAGAYEMTPTSSAVYRQFGGRLWTVPDELTYYTWQSDFRTVTRKSMLNGASSGTLQMRPGTLVKLANHPDVYVILSDWTRRKVQDEQTAQALAGRTWSRTVLTLNPATLAQYQLTLPPVTDATDLFLSTE